MQAKILIVEDETVIALELEDRLQRMGYAVAGSAPNGKAALQMIEAARPDIVLMDINLKGARDGIEIAEEIRARYDIPVIYLTAYADHATLRRARDTTPFGYLLKPFREAELHANIEMAVHKHRADNYLREQANQDALTGLYNRRFLNEALPREFERAQRNNSGLSLAMLDIDMLKSVNDTYGHEAGDQMIRRVAEIVQLSLRKSDLVCRYGGDEIAIVLPDSPLSNAIQKMESILAQISTTPLRVGDTEMTVTVSIGVAAMSEHTHDAYELLHAADQALYRSKQSGRNSLNVV